MDSSKVMKIY